MTLRNSLTVPLFAFFSIYIAFISIAGDTANEDPANTVEARIRDLQLERHELLKRRLEKLTNSYERGETSLDTKLNAEYDLLKAQLQSCVTRSDRVKAIRPIIQNRRRLEEHRALGVEQGTCLEEDLLVARADTLHAEISLLRELPQHATLTTTE